ncbi:MAG TPA: DUF937 domain-containing protein [Stenotrophobium sp.]|jgi:hypothetical protein|nr:DUF937 domain-containing protein [Stenotrophobium sp.]
MNILDTILNSQGGQAASKLASQFGVNPEQMTQTLQSAVPAVVGGVKNAVGQSGGLQKLHDMLQAGNHQQYLDNITQAFSADGIAAGQQALTKLFGSGDAVNQVAGRVAAATGVATEKVSEILPVAADLVMGVLNKVQQSPLGGLAESALNSPLGKMAGGLLGGARQGAADPLSAIKAVLDAHGGGGIADEIKGLAGSFFKS